MKQEYLDIIVLAIIAVILVYKLSKSLGTKSDEDEERKQNKNLVQAEKELQKNKENVVDFQIALQAGLVDGKKNDDENVLENPIQQELYQIQQIDQSFNPDKFLNGAKKAFEMIVGAFCKGDEQTLKGLLDKKVYEKFSKAIQIYKEKGHKIEQTLVAFKEVKIVDAIVINEKAKITVEFETEQAKSITDSEGNLIEGDKVMISTVFDIWQFEKDLKSQSPNWLLVSTKSGT